MTSEIACLKVRNVRECVLSMEYWKYRKKKPKAWTSLEVLVTRLVSGGTRFVTYANFGQPELV